MKSIGRMLLPLAALVTGLSVNAAPVSGMGTWETTLLPRDIDGNGTVDAYYDTAQDISWLANADAIGAGSFAAARAWAAGLNVAGVTGWRLPDVAIDTCRLDAYDGSTASGFASDVGNGQCGYNVDPTTSEMAWMYYRSLGNQSYYGTNVPLIANTGPFDNLQPTGYWSSRDYALDVFNGNVVDPNLGWRFSFYAGRQDTIAQSFTGLHAWAVHDGDVMRQSSVPEPQSLALVALGFAALALRGRRRQPTADSRKLT